MSSRISESKAISIANVMSKPILKRQNALTEELCDLITQCFIDHLPQDVLDFYSKYPDHTRMAGNFYYKSRKPELKSVYVTMPSIPSPCREASGYMDVILEHPEIFKKAETLCDKIMQAEKEYAAMKGKIKCALINLKTYARIKSDFPEAYALLMEGVEDEETTNLCDSVGSIRAALNSKNK